MFKAIKEAHNCILKDTTFTDSLVLIMIAAAFAIVIIGGITGVASFTSDPKELGDLVKIAEPGALIWKIIFSVEMVGALFAIISYFTYNSYPIGDENRYLSIYYIWIFIIASGVFFVVFALWLIAIIFMSIVKIIAFCCNHFFSLFIPKKKPTNTDIIKTEKEMLYKFNNFLNH